MEDSSLQNLTLAAWTVKIWTDYKRGLPLNGQNAAIAAAMQEHKEWWADWENLARLGPAYEQEVTSRLVHIHSDATIQLQIENGQPKEVRKLHDALIEKGFTQYEAIHTLVLALVDESAYARENGEPFDTARYIERMHRYVQEALSRPNLKRQSKSKLY